MFTLKASRYGHIGYFEVSFGNQYFKQCLEIIKKVPSSVWNKKNKIWTVALADYDIFIKDCEEKNFKYINVENPLKVILGQYTRWKNELTILTQKEDIDSKIGNDFLNYPMMPHQKVTVEFNLRRKVALNGDEMGCIDGESIISFSRGGKSFKIKLKDAYERFNWISKNINFNWDKKIKTTCRCLKNNRFGLNDVEKILFKGTKECLEIKTESNKKIRLTFDHELLNKNKDWIEAKSLKVNDEILVNGEDICIKCFKNPVVTYKYSKYKGYCKKCIYKYLRKHKNEIKGITKRKGTDGYIYLKGEGVKFHKRKHSPGLLEHIYIMENYLGRELSKNEEVHHKNKIKDDNRLKNLELVTISKHAKLHKVENHFGDYIHKNGNKIITIPKIEKITSVKFIGKIDVYDIVMKDPYRNFVANNIVVHNCGKTLPALVTAQYLKNIGAIKNCLIVCIASVKWNWAHELNKFIKNSDYIVIEGTVKKRIEQYMSPHFIKIVNFELLRNDYESILYDTVFDCIIVDEIHRIRNYKNKQTKVLVDIGKRAEYRFGLTGTPIQNKLKDLYSIMKFIHPGLLGDWYSFDNRYNVRGYFGEVCGHEKLNEVHEKLKSVMIRRLKKDVLKDLPPKIWSDIYIEMPSKQRKFYSDVRKKILRANTEEIEEKVTQANILTNLTYLREVCDSCELIDPEIQISAKLDEIKVIVPEIVENGHKVVIFSQFKRMINIIGRDLGLPVIKLTGDIAITGGARDKLIKEFTESKDKNVFLMTTAGGEGINLQCADYVIFVDLPFNPQVIAQIEDRLHRKGQENTVNIIRLITKNTVEDRILEILDFKIKLFQEIVEGKVPESKMLECEVTQKEILKAVKYEW